MVKRVLAFTDEQFQYLHYIVSVKHPFALFPTSGKEIKANLAVKLIFVVFLGLAYQAEQIYSQDLTPNLPEAQARISNDPVFVVEYETPLYLDTGITEEKKAQLQEANVSIPTNSDSVKLIWPIRGTITTYFSYAHPGIDIAQSGGIPIKPIMGGKVIKAGWEPGYGNTIIVDHTNGLTSRYAHLSKFNSKLGQIVYQEQVIGYVGTTGWSTGNHLHLEVYLRGRPVNPLNYLTIVKE